MSSSNAAISSASNESISLQNKYIGDNLTTVGDKQGAEINTKLALAGHILENDADSSDTQSTDQSLELTPPSAGQTDSGALLARTLPSLVPTLSSGDNSEGSDLELQPPHSDSSISYADTKVAAGVVGMQEDASAKTILVMAKQLIDSSAPGPVFQQ